MCILLCMDMGRLYEESSKLWKETSSGDLYTSLRLESNAQDGNLLLHGDNLVHMAALSAQIQEGSRPPVALVYMDPPYFSKRSKKTLGFSDTWESMEAYLTMLSARIIAARELLADDGAMWIHLDRRAVHYAKILADVAFGSEDCLVNEVVWSYKSGGSSSKRFANKHDTLLFYAKNKRKYKFFPQQEKSYNRGLKPYRFKGVKEYRDDHGWYTMVNMKDVWEIPMVGRTAAERTGYATQKPEALMERIVFACTEEGDICLDPFGGSGTLAAVCAKHGRGWIYIDESLAAVEVAARRLGLR